MKLLKKVLITVGREYGSGGRAIAEGLGRDLNIPVFDKNMIAIPIRSLIRTLHTDWIRVLSPSGFSLLRLISSRNRLTRAPLSS